MSRDDDGFTLLEVVLAVTIVSLVAIGLAAAASVGMRTVAAASDRVAASASARSLAVHLPPDVQSAVDAVVSADGTGIVCGGVSGARLRLVGADGFEVVYAVRSTSRGWVLERHECGTGARFVVARGLADGAAVVATRVPATGTFVGVAVRVRRVDGAVTVDARRRDT